MSWQNPFEKRAIKKPDTAEGEGDNVVAFEQPVVIARDGLGNPIGTAESTIDADALRRHDAEDKLAA